MTEATIPPTRLRTEDVRDLKAHERAALAFRADLTEEVQLILAADKQTAVCAELARNTGITPRVQKVLAGLGYWNVMENLAGNMCLVPGIQRDLTRRGEHHQVLLAANPKIIRELQVEYSKLPEGAVRHALAGNAHIDLAVLRDLWEHEKAEAFVEFTFEVLLQNPALPPDLLAEAVTYNDPYVRSMVAQNQSLTLAMKLQLAQDNDTDVRVFLALEGASTAEVLEVLVRDKEPIVRRALAGRRNLSLSVYRALSFDATDEVQISLQRNESVECTEDFQAQFVLAKNPVLYHVVTAVSDREALESLLPTWNGSLRQLVEAVGLINR